MNIIMTNARIFSIPELEKLILANEKIAFKAKDKTEAYQWIATTLRDYRYSKLGKRERGVVIDYIVKMTSYSRRQIKRLTRQWLECSSLRVKPYVHNKFNGKYTRQDTILLAQVDDAHEVLSGPATRRVLEREFVIYGKSEFERLAGISVSHIYNLRHSFLYHQNIVTFTKTKGPKNTLGIRHKPEPNNRTGFLRVDSVHQGDLPMDERGSPNSGKSNKGVYHINFVDEVTQYEFVACVQTICERDMLPVLKSIIDAFPFVIHEFHADNGSEYINKVVASLLKKLYITLSKSRPRQHNDNALVETKNGGIIRKCMGYNYIPAYHAGIINDWYRDHFNDYLNFHRPCGFATTTIDHKGKERKVYKANDYMTPYRKLKSLENVAQYLKPGITIALLDRKEAAMSDTEYAVAMNKAKYKMLSIIE